MVGLLHPRLSRLQHPRAGGLDTPLERTPVHAKDGLLNIMTAGDEEAFLSFYFPLSIALSSILT